MIEKTLLSSQIINGKSTTLAEYFIGFNKMRTGWEANQNLKNLYFLPNSDRTNFNLTQDSVLKSIYNSINTTENLKIFQKDKKITITTVEVNSNSELFSKLFCESLVKETSNYYIEIKTKKAKLNVELLQKQADSIRKELNYAINGVAVSTDNIFNFNPAKFIKRAPSTIRQVDVQTNNAVLTQVIVNLELAKIALRKETPLIQVIDHPILPLEKSKLSKFKAMVLGGFFVGLLTTLYLIFNQYLKKIFLDY